jgi:hypothetical protein
VVALVHGGELAPNTLVTSPAELVLVFSSSMLAMLNAPTSQPARVNGTHGAGVFVPRLVIKLNAESVVLTGSVQ